MKYLSPLLMFVLLFATSAQADVSPQHRLLTKSTYVLEEVLSTPDVDIPQRLIRNAKAVIVFPNMIKAGFIGAMRYGKGVATVRDPKTGKWGPPSFVTTIGGSVGFQIGAEAIDLVLLVMSDKGVKGVLNNEFTLGGDMDVTAGPVGRHAEAGVDIFLQGDVYSYSRSQGLFAGVSLKGTVIKSNREFNHQYYRQNLSAEEIMISSELKRVPESSKRFMRDFNRMAPSALETQVNKMALLEKENAAPAVPPVKRQPAPRKKKPTGPLW